MNLLLYLIAIAVCIASTDAIGHNEVAPFAQPEPVTVSEKAAVKFKPQLKIMGECHSYPAVNAAGETSGGLKGTGFTSGCEGPSLGSQVYGRSAWHNDVWAIMYAWYFPKGFWAGFASRRHDWSSIVVWIDNPALETPRIMGLSISKGDTKYRSTTSVPAYALDGTSLKMYRDMAVLVGPASMDFAGWRGAYQDLILWDQLTDAARSALNTTDFGKAEVPFNDAHFAERLEKAWPF